MKYFTTGHRAYRKKFKNQFSANSVPWLSYNWPKYEIEVMERCGVNYYGCCEPLHNKMGILAKVPRLRKISISPWCDVPKAAANAHQPYVFSHKPSPAMLAEDGFNVERAEKDISA